MNVVIFGEEINNISESYLSGLFLGLKIHGDIKHLSILEKLDDNNLKILMSNKINDKYCFLDINYIDIYYDLKQSKTAKEITQILNYKLNVYCNIMMEYKYVIIFTSNFKKSTCLLMFDNDEILNGIGNIFTCLNRYPCELFIFKNKKLGSLSFIKEVFLPIEINFLNIDKKVYICPQVIVVKYIFEGNTSNCLTDSLDCFGWKPLDLLEAIIIRYKCIHEEKLKIEIKKEVKCVKLKFLRDNVYVPVFED